MRPEFTAIAAFIVAVGAVARLTRLLTSEEFPPAVWVRIRWDTVTKDGEWSKIAHCLWCAPPYISAPILVWGWLSDLHWTWWAFCIWMTVSYLSSWVVFHDEDGS